MKRRLKQMIQTIKEQIKALETEARNLKTKQAKAKRYDLIRELRSQAFDLLHEEAQAFKTHTVKGVVTAVGSAQDFLYAETPYGRVMLFQCADELSKSWYVETCCIEYIKGQTITIEVDIDVNMENLSLQLAPKTIRGGKVNEAKYAELCKRTDLAFFKYPTGMNGLFSSKGA